MVQITQRLVCCATGRRRKGGKMNDRYLIQSMLQAVKEINPEYPAHLELDAKPLFKIAEFIYNQMNLTRGAENHAYTIVPVWKMIYAVVQEDSFFGQKSLATISTHIQEFYQKAAHGDRKNAKLSTDKLKQKIAARYAGRRKK